MLKIIDSHSHLNDEKLINDIDNILLKMKEYNVVGVLIPGYTYGASLDAIKLAEENKEFYAAIGIHPQNIDDVDLSILDKIEENLNNKKVIAIGEIGLDYHYRDDNKEKQFEFFLKQLDLSYKYNLPVVIHSRDATNDTLTLLKDYIKVKGKRENIGIMHSFSGSIETMNEYINLGFYISFSGPVTFKNARINKECATACPLDRILVETDAPYLTPEPHRGERNEPAYVYYTLKHIAELKGITIEELGDITYNNFKKLFNLEDLS